LAWRRQRAGGSEISLHLPPVRIDFQNESTAQSDAVSDNIAATQDCCCRGIRTGHKGEKVLLICSNVDELEVRGETGEIGYYLHEALSIFCYDKVLVFGTYA
jgi:hypothetical protein